MAIDASVSEGPLTGLRVLDLALERAGSTCTMLLADLGADVVRVETSAGTHRRPDPTEDAGPVCWDRGKRRMVVDSLDPHADATLARVAGVADVLVVDGGPSRLQELGLHPDTLAVRFPRAVIGWLPANGMHGELADLPADPLILAAISGYAQWQPSLLDAPVAPVVPYVSSIQGALGASAVVAALVERQASGAGQVVSVTGLHASTILLATVSGQSLDQPMAYMSSRVGRGSPFFRPYRGGDGNWFFLGALVPTIFLAALDAVDLLEVMVLPGIDGEFLNLMVGDNGERAGAALERRFSEHPRQHWLDVFAAAGVPAAPVQTREEWQASDAFARVGGLVQRRDPRLGTVTLPASPIKLSATPARVGDLAGECDPVDAALVWTDARPEPAPQEQRRSGAPLAGLKVLDLSTFLAGPMGPTLLCQWGAEVVKVEPTSGDPYRLYNVAYTGANQGKRRVALDLGSREGMAAFRSLAAEADVVVDNFRPSLRAKLGMSTDALHAVNPRIVHATLSAFGDDGPLAESPGFDPIIQACSGLMHACGDDEEPYYTSTPVHDVATGSLITLGTLAALYARRSSGQGQRVALSLAASTLLVQCEELTTYAGRPTPPRGGSASLGTGPMRRFYRASDGWVAVATGPDRLDELLGWSGGPNGEGPAERIAAAVRACPARDVVRELSARGIAAARVVEREEQSTDDHLRAHQLLHEVLDPDIGRCLVVNQVAAWSRSTPVDTTSGPPREPEEPVWRSGEPES